MAMYVQVAVRRYILYIPVGTSPDIIYRSIIYMSRSRVRYMYLSLVPDQMHWASENGDVIVAVT